MKHGIQKTSTLEIIMRDYAFTLAQPHMSEALIPQIIQCLKTMMKRRKIRQALLCSGRCPVLGLADDDLRHLLTLPMSCNLEMEIERIKFTAARTLRN